MGTQLPEQFTSYYGDLPDWQKWYKRRPIAGQMGLVDPKRGETPTQWSPGWGPGAIGMRAGQMRERGMENYLADQYSWLFGGRPLSEQEKAMMMPPITAGRDPRFGTIGGMPSVGQGPQAAGAGAAGYRPIKGFETAFGETIPYQEVGPTPAAMKDVGALAQLPYDLMDQYRRIADQGIYGPAGMHQIVSRGIPPQMERTKRTTTEALTHARAARQQTVAQGARMLGKQLGGKFASQPGLAMKLMGDQIIAPSLAREMEMSIDLKTNEMLILNALDGAIGDLLKANQESKLLGLAGVQDVMGFLQKRVADRWWDLSMENKFGWSPERTAAAGTYASKSLAELMQQFGLDRMKMDAYWRDWLNEQQYIREEYGVGRGGIGRGFSIGNGNETPIEGG